MARVEGIKPSVARHSLQLRMPAPDEVLRALWDNRRTLLISALVAAVVAVPLSFLRPPVYTSSAQVLIPARDPVVGNDSKAGTSVVAIKLDQYASNQFPDDVRERLGEDASRLRSVRAVRERNPIFYRLTSTAETPAFANESLEVASTVLIDQANAIAEQQLDALSKDVTARIEELRKAEAPLRTQQSNKQIELDSLLNKRRDLEGGLLQARDTVNRSRIVGGSASTSAAQAVAADLQKEIDALNPQLEPKQKELDEVNGQLSVVAGQRESLEELLRSSTRSYVSYRVNSTVSEPPQAPSNVKVRRAGQAALLGGFAGLLLAAAMLVRAQVRSEPFRPEPDHSPER